RADVNLIAVLHLVLAHHRPPPLVAVGTATVQSTPRHVSRDLHVSRSLHVDLCGCQQTLAESVAKQRLLTGSTCRFTLTSSGSRTSPRGARRSDAARDRGSSPAPTARGQRHRERLYGQPASHLATPPSVGRGAATAFGAKWAPEVL